MLTKMARRTAVLTVASALAVAGLIGATPAVAQNRVIVAPGTTITLRTESAINSQTAQAGDVFRARVVNAVESGGVNAIPVGSIVTGRVLSVASAKRFGQPTGATVKVDQITSPSGVSVNLIGDLADSRGVPFITVDNLPVGAEVFLRVNRPLTLTSEFFGGNDFFDSRETVRLAQIVLRDLGYYNAAINGNLTPVTRRAIEAFQREERISPTGFLDRTTLERLGLVSESGNEVSAVNVISAQARVRNNDSLAVRVVTSGANNLQLFEDHFRRGNTMHIYVRGYGAPGYTGGTNELNVVLTPNEWNGVERVVVHSTGNDIVIRRTDVASGDMMTWQEAARLENEITTLVSRYAQVLGVRYNRTTGQLQFSQWNYRENEVELLFALNSLGTTAQLYTRLLRTSNDPQAVKGATDVYVQQANIVERAFTRTRSGRANDVRPAWNALQNDLRALAEASSRDFQNR
jgi:peptidoglycan hydrolase-like protein with peptidoglycan-binding domain